MTANVGWNEFEHIGRIEQQASDLGFVLGRSRYSGDVIALYPDTENNRLGIYAEDAELYVASSIYDIEHWLRGIQWARTYDTMIKLSTPKKREQAEAREEARIAKMRKDKEQQKIVEILSA